jgi:hypothetical protein
VTLQHSTQSVNAHSPMPEQTYVPSRCHNSVYVHAHSEGGRQPTPLSPRATVGGTPPPCRFCWTAAGVEPVVLRAPRPAPRRGGSRFDVGEGIVNFNDTHPDLQMIKDSERPSSTISRPS